MTSPVELEEAVVVGRKMDRESRGCSVCGGLNCLCRPRFFTGQLLTEDDFRLLDNYIVEKNRLRNRYLHGSGIVCGLDVVCGPCNEGIMVKEGYAISPCGDDIIVCRDTKVDICELINQCRQRPVEDCENPNTDQQCQKPEQSWVLAICYDETMKRGVVPLRNSSGCGCGGQYEQSRPEKNSGVSSRRYTAARTSGGCGCGGSSTVASPAPAEHAVEHADEVYTGHNRKVRADAPISRGSSPAHCEPSVICEGYRFVVYPAPAQRDSKRAQGAMATRFMECINAFRKAIPPMPPSQDVVVMTEWLSSVKWAILQYLEQYEIYDCELRRAIANVQIPSPNQSSNTFPAEFSRARDQLLAITGEIFIACFCRALQPPCPDSGGDNCIPLAVVDVSYQNGCAVSSICNWTTLRKYVMTMPNVQYWLSILPVGNMLREALERFCCSGGGFRDFRKKPVAVQDAAIPVAGDATYMRAAMNTTNETAAAEQPNMQQQQTLQDVSPASYFQPGAESLRTNGNIVELFMQAMPSVMQSMDARTLMSGVLGMSGGKGEPIFSGAQSSQLAQFFVLDQMVKPIVRSFMGMQDPQTPTPEKPIVREATTKKATAKKTTVKKATTKRAATKEATKKTAAKKSATIKKTTARKKKTDDNK